MATYCCSDLHGCMWAYKKIKKYIKPEDRVYVIGDCGDRGPQPWDTIKAVYNDPQMIYLKGNHEDMLMKAMNAYLAHNFHGFYSKEANLCRSNGGEDTIEGWLLEPDKELAIWRDKLMALPTAAVYVNKDGKRIYLNHSGVDESGTEKDILWDREHFFTWTSEQYDIIVHGHTPIPILVEDYLWIINHKLEIPNGALWYCNNRKIDIDCGTVWTNKTVLLNLDTFEEKIFVR